MKTFVRFFFDTEIPILGSSLSTSLTLHWHDQASRRQAMIAYFVFGSGGPIKIFSFFVATCLDFAVPCIGHSDDVDNCRFRPIAVFFVATCLYFACLSALLIELSFFSPCSLVFMNNGRCSTRGACSKLSTGSH